MRYRGRTPAVPTPAVPTPAVPAPSPEELRVEAAWLYSLTGNRCPWQVTNVQDLLNYIETVRFRYYDDLTGAQLNALFDLGERLTIPAEILREREVERAEGLQQLDDHLQWRYNRGAMLSKLGAAARRGEGDETRKRVLRAWKRLANIPARERAVHVAASLQLTVRHVRRLVLELGLR
jgi:hypothetical protein